jgi:hypothetical protein
MRRKRAVAENRAPRRLPSIAASERRNLFSIIAPIRSPDDAGSARPHSRSMKASISGSLMPQNRSTSSCSVIEYPRAVKTEAWARLIIGSVSTSTPSQSKITSSNCLAVICARCSLSSRRHPMKRAKSEHFNGHISGQRTLNIIIGGDRFVALNAFPPSATGVQFSARRSGRAGTDKPLRSLVEPMLD